MLLSATIIFFDYRLCISPTTDSSNRGNLMTRQADDQPTHQLRRFPTGFHERKPNSNFLMQHLREGNHFRLHTGTACRVLGNLLKTKYKKNTAADHRITNEIADTTLPFTSVLTLMDAAKRGDTHNLACYSRI